MLIRILYYKYIAFGDLKYNKTDRMHVLATEGMPAEWFVKTVKKCHQFTPLPTVYEKLVILSEDALET